MLILSERQLRHIVNDYVTNFNQARPQQGIDQRIPGCPHVPTRLTVRLMVPVPGGLHHDYRRKAT